MLPILHHPELTAGLADEEAERLEAWEVERRVYRKAGYYAGEPPSMPDEDDMVSHVFLARGTDGAVFAAARYIPGREGRPLPVEEAFELFLPPALQTIPVARRLEGEIFNERPMKGGVAALALVNAAFLFYGARGDYDVTIHVAIGRWADRVRKAGFVFHDIPVVRPTYPADGPLAPYYYRNPEPLSCHYGLVTENRRPAVSCCLALGMQIEPVFRAG